MTPSPSVLIRPNRDFKQPLSEFLATIRMRPPTSSAFNWKLHPPTIPLPRSPVSTSVQATDQLPLTPFRAALTDSPPPPLWKAIGFKFPEPAPSPVMATQPASPSRPPPRPTPSGSTDLKGNSNFRNAALGWFQLAETSSLSQASPVFSIFSRKRARQRDFAT